MDEGMKLIAKAEALEEQAKAMLRRAQTYRMEASELYCNLPNDWIWAKDLLPKVDKASGYSKDVLVTDGDWCYVAFLDKNGDFVGSQGVIDGITHWKPLPPAPNKYIGDVH